MMDGALRADKPPSGNKAVHLVATITALPFPGPVLISMMSPSMAESSMSARKVLLPFDGSPAARRALEYLAAVADRETHVHLLNVQPPTIDDDVYLDPLVRGGEQVLRDAARHLEAKAIRHTSQVAIGWPADAIVRSARSESCTAIVMGVRSAIARLLSGSVSRGVVREAGVPVTLVSTSGETVVRMP